MQPSTGKLIVLAMGGNSLIKDETKKSVEDQYHACFETCGNIVALLEQGNRVVITHGNGPQVGFILRRSELASKELHMVPLASCVADTQGAIGYQIQRAMYSRMKDWDSRRPVATVVTQMIVDANDKGFANPTKPIGSFMDAETAALRKEHDGWQMVEDSGRGFRRVVASPRPLEIVELAAIRRLVSDGFVVVAAGGGGIPVAKEPDGTLTSVAAVIDKDLASSLLARNLGADILLISTAVEQVQLDFGKPTQRPLASMTVAEAKEYIAQGHFAPGSMLPKIEAMIEFIEGGGEQAIVTDPPNLLKAVTGETGTRIVP